MGKISSFFKNVFKKIRWAFTAKCPKCSTMMAEAEDDLVWWCPNCHHMIDYSTDYSLKY